MGNILLALIVSIVSFSFFPDEVAARRLQVQLRNYTSGQGMQNPMVAVGPSVAVFSVGARAPVSLDKLAEGGECWEVANLLAQRGAATVCNNMIVYGQAYIADLQIPSGDLFLTMLVKIAPTNSGFGAIQSLKIPGSVVPGVWHGASFNAFDAGGEYKDEKCVHLNAPAACGGFSGQGYSGIPEPKQGNKVQYHPGLHGNGDLDPAVNNFVSPIGAVYYQVVN